MARPPKKAALVMSVDLRIPVTPEQKRLIGDAISALGSDMAAWARPILLRAAEDVLANSKKAKRR